MPRHIAALTGIRFCAAAWVVLFHIDYVNHETIAERHPLLSAVIHPVVAHGDLGVDLFFLLSGFVLAWNYLGELGPRADLASTGRFLWLRLARIWPLHIVVMLGAGALIWLRYQAWGSDTQVGQLSWRSFVAQVFLVQQWGSDNVPDTSWSGPAWSISAEWLAYLCFPVLALVVWRLQRRLPRAALAGLAVAVLMPVLVVTWVRESQAGGFVWLVRLSCEFTAGMLLCAALSGMDPSPRLRRAAGRAAPALVAAVVAWLWAVAVAGAPWAGALAMPLFLPLVACLVLGEGRLHDRLGSRWMVLGGQLSFALYLVHVPLLKLFRDVVAHTDWVPLSSTHLAYGELGVALVSVVLAYLLFHHVEEPARRAMRTVVPRTPATPLPARSGPSTVGEVQPSWQTQVERMSVLTLR